MIVLDLNESCFVSLYFYKFIPEHDIPSESLLFNPFLFLYFNLDFHSINVFASLVNWILEVKLKTEQLVRTNSSRTLTICTGLDHAPSKFMCLLEFQKFSCLQLEWLLT